jgi:galactokinase
MDQFAVTFGRADHLLLLDCRSQERTLVPMQSADVGLLIINSMVKHALTDGGYAARREECFLAAHQLEQTSLRDVSLSALLAAEGALPPVAFRRARHVITENARVLDAVQAWRDGAWETLGQLMFASHASLRDDFSVSCAELDQLVTLAREIGVHGGIYGCRMTGGGFGGCVVALVRREALTQVAETLSQRYAAATGHQPWTLITPPAEGARVLSREP